MDRWLAVVRNVDDFRISKNAGISVLAEDLLAFQEELCCLESVT
jgi:hypothetical protein